MRPDPDHPETTQGAKPAALPSTGLDDVVHQRVRLGILTAVNEVKQADFNYLRGLLELTGGNLSRHLDVLARDALIDLRKGYEGQRPRTWITITPRGQDALRAEIDTLRRLVARYDLLTEHTPTEV